MLFRLLLLLTSELVLAINVVRNPSCYFSLYAIPNDESVMMQKDCDLLFGGMFAEISTEEVKSLAFDSDFARLAEDRYGMYYRMRIRAFCRATPGWSSFHFRTSDKDAVSISFSASTRGRNYLFEVEEQDSDDDEGIVLEEGGLRYIEKLLSLRHPTDLDSWHVDFRACAHNERLEPVTILPDKKAVTTFPQVESLLHMALSKGPDSTIPASFPKEYTCLMELRRDIPSPRTTPLFQLFVRIDAQCPITAETLWTIATSQHRELANADGLPISLDDTHETKVIRIYASNEVYGVSISNRSMMQACSIMWGSCRLERNGCCAGSLILRLGLLLEISQLPKSDVFPRVTSTSHHVQPDHKRSGSEQKVIESV